MHAASKIGACMHAFACSCMHACMRQAYPLSNENNTLLQEQQMKLNKHQAPLLEHVMGCNAINKFFYTERHEYVKTAIINIARSYGIQCTPEPSFYIYAF